MAIIALLAGVLPNIPGFLATIGSVEGVPAFWTGLHGYAWFVGFRLAFATYLGLRKLAPSP